MNRCTTAFVSRRLFGSIALAAAASASLLAQAQGLPATYQVVYAVLEKPL